MRLEMVRTWWSDRSWLEKTAVLVWCILLLVICIRVAISPRAHSVFPIFSTAGRNWLHGQNLYYPYFFDPDLDNFRYSPLAATVFVPWSALSDRIGNVVWRLFSAGLYLSALAWLARTALPVCLNRSQQALLFLLAVPLSIGCLNNGQSNVVLITLLLACTAAAQAGRWNLAAGCVALATLFKIYPIVLGLLLILVYPRKFTARFLLALAVGLSLPFLLQRPDYVARQYVHWWDLLMADNRLERPISNMVSRDLWLAIRLAAVPMSSAGYHVIQVLLGGGMALLSLAGRFAAWPQHRLLTMIFSLAGCWMVLCGPASESCTYILLAPILAWAVLEAGLDGRPLWSRLIPWCSFGLFVVSQTISWFPEDVRMVFLGILPFAGIVLWTGLVESSIRNLVQNWRGAPWATSFRSTPGANTNRLAACGFARLRPHYLREADGAER
jgi:hypothetical protein